MSDMTDRFRAPQETNGSAELFAEVTKQDLRLKVRRKLILPVLAGLGIVGGGAVGREWKTTVDRHIEASAGGYQRIGDLERRVGTVETEIRDMRRDQLEQWRWQAQRVADRDRVQALERRLRELEGR